MRLNQFYVDVSEDNITKTRCGVYDELNSVPRGSSHPFNCNGTQGRYVYVGRLPGATEQKMMTLCEVTVSADTLGECIYIR